MDIYVLTAVKLLRFFSFLSFFSFVEELYVVVQFVDDSSVCTVPVKQVDLGEASRPEIASVYPVQWTNREKFDAEVLAVGKSSMHVSLS